ncbi:hypothetical protein CSV79_14255 [Sporosarcina sp. P13]|nr:hypothetical protein CSV79_14255 [Sporosarcina sp. P13]
MHRPITKELKITTKNKEYVEKNLDVIVIVIDYFKQKVLIVNNYRTSAITIDMGGGNSAVKGSVGAVAGCNSAVKGSVGAAAGCNSAVM